VNHAAADFTVEVRDDADDPHLIHATCGATICTVEHGDNLDVLLRTAAGHECEGPPARPATDLPSEA
jgi:hypothetical protein